MILANLIEHGAFRVWALSILGVLLFASVIVYLVIWLLIRKLKPLRGALGGDIIKRFWGRTYLRLDREGVETRIGLTPGSRTSPPSLYIKRMAPLGFDLSLKKENFASLKLERWDMIQDIKVGDLSFDDRYLIQGSDPSKIHKFLLQTGRREAVDHFFKKGFTVIQADESGLTASKPRYQDRDLDPELMRSHLEKIDKLFS